MARFLHFRRRAKATSPVPESQRRSIHEIFFAAADNARNEVRRPATGLILSGLAGGLTMGLSALGVAISRALLGDHGAALFLSYALYPLGFIAVIIGRAQLFTENTLYPVLLVLNEGGYVWRTLRLWLLVFLANIAGALLFALLAVRSGGLHSEFRSALVQLGEQAVMGVPYRIFWSGVIGGWLIALVAWEVTASHWTIGQVVLIWLLTFVVGAGRFAHCIASSCEILSAVAAGALPWGNFLRWLLPATLGNIAGGVMIVSVLNYGQIREEIQESNHEKSEGPPEKPATANPVRPQASGER